MNRSLKEDSFGEFLSVLFEAERSHKKPRGKNYKPSKEEEEAEKAEIAQAARWAKAKFARGAVELPLSFDDNDPEPSAPRQERNRDPHVPTTRPMNKPLGSEEGLPFYAPKSKSSSPEATLNKLKKDAARGVIAPEDFEKLKNKVAATTSPAIQRRGLGVDPGVSSVIKAPVDTPSSRAGRARWDGKELSDELDMEPYRGRDERIGTANDAAGDDEEADNDDLNPYSKLASYVGREKVKIGSSDFKSPGDEGYEEWQPVDEESGVPISDAGEWSEADLPMKGYVDAPTNTSSARKTAISADEKLNLAKNAPKFVLQGMVQAAKDYKEMLRPALAIFKKAALDYAKDLKRTGELSDEDFKLLTTDEGLAKLIGMEKTYDPEKGEATGGFAEFFDDWRLGARKTPHGTIPGADPSIVKQFSPDGGIKKSVWRSALEVIKRLQIIDLDDDSVSSGDTAAMLGLRTKFQPELSRVEQFLMVRKSKTDRAAGDPGFRYYFGEVQAAGKQEFYWDWIRRQARKHGAYPENASWATKGKKF